MLLFTGYAMISGVAYAPDTLTTEYVSEATAAFDAAADRDEEAAAVPLGSIELCEKKEEVAMCGQGVAAMVLCVDARVPGNVENRCKLLADFYTAIDRLGDEGGQCRLMLQRALRSCYKGEAFVTSLDLRGAWENQESFEAIRDQMNVVFRDMLNMIVGNPGIALQVMFQSFAESDRLIVNEYTQQDGVLDVRGCIGALVKHAAERPEVQVVFQRDQALHSSKLGIVSPEFDVMPIIRGVCEAAGWRLKYDKSESEVKDGNTYTVDVYTMQGHDLARSQEASLPAKDRVTFHNGRRLDRA